MIDFIGEMAIIRYAEETMRPVGKHIRAALERSDALRRWAIASELTAGLGILSTASTRICRRAVWYGLAEVDETARPLKFKALPNWRHRINMPHISTGKIDEKADAFKRAPDRLPAKIINSVWSLSNA